MAKNILICDDAAFMRMMIKDILTTDGYSIGWGKLAGGIRKNHYPKGLRITERE